MLDNGLGMITFLLACNVILLLAGNFMEPSSIVLIFAPILFPVAMKLGIDPVHFGIIMVVNMEVGMCHPPVGLNCTRSSGITKMGITRLTWPSGLIAVDALFHAGDLLPTLSIWFPRYWNDVARSVNLARHPGFFSESGRRAFELENCDKISSYRFHSTFCWRFRCLSNVPCRSSNPMPWPRT
jgi:hypothetical protein